MTLGQLRNHLFKLVDQSYLAGKITLGDNEPFAQKLDVIDVAWGKHGVHADDNTTSLNRSLTLTFSEVTCVYLFAMRTHTVEVIAVKQIVQLLLIKLYSLAFTKPVGPVEALILYSLSGQGLARAARVSSPCHLKRSMRISRTTLTYLLKSDSLWDLLSESAFKSEYTERHSHQTDQGHDISNHYSTSSTQNRDADVHA